MGKVSDLPSTPAPDTSLALLREGYEFIGKRCDNLNSDAFRTRLMLSPVVCMRGGDAAEAFYAGGRFSRERAMPANALKLLQDYGSVQMLEGDAHKHRKAMFLDALNADAVQALVSQFAQMWRERLPAWERAERIVLYDEMRRMLLLAVCGWAGVPLRETEIPERLKEFTAMIESTGSFGPRNWRAQRLRRRSERWARDLLLAIRTGATPAGKNTAAHVIAHHRDLDGSFLAPEAAAVELLNIIRPTVAISHYIVFAALALHRHPEWRAVFRSGDDTDLANFVQEVRRLSPFIPFMGGRVQKPFRWRETEFSPGQWVLLDLYGTCRHAAHWSDPDAFRPERFRDRDHGFNFLPQGAGSYLTDHRCPGEPLTIAVTMEAVRLLTRVMEYDVPEQDFTVDLSRIPALPRSKFAAMRVRKSR
jgi:fatty-acid peroxygenase